LLCGSPLCHVEARTLLGNCRWRSLAWCLAIT
jgi:hypothetical protein